MAGKSRVTALSQHRDNKQEALKTRLLEAYRKAKSADDGRSVPLHQLRRADQERM